MRTIIKTQLIALCLLTGSMTACFSGDGRYQVTSLSKTAWILTDTKSGQFRLCILWDKDETRCNPWVDGMSNELKTLSDPR